MSGRHFSSEICAVFGGSPFFADSDPFSRLRSATDKATLSVRILVDEDYIRTVQQLCQMMGSGDAMRVQRAISGSLALMDVIALDLQARTQSKLDEQRKAIANRSPA